MDPLVKGCLYAFFSIAVTGIFTSLIHLYNVLVLKPERLRSKLRSQGVSGPPPTFLIGNIREMRKIQSSVVSSSNDGEVRHDWSSTVFSCFEQWRNTYGSKFICSLGNIQILYVTDPEIVKEIGLCTSLDLGKPSYLQKEWGPLLGQGILTANGDAWAHLRKIIAPELYMNKVKGMVTLMVESATTILHKWDSKVENEKGLADIRVDEDLRTYSADIISKACFGSTYSNGEEIFLRLRALQGVMSKQSLLRGIPGLRHLPTKNNREIWRLDREIRQLILKVAKDRKETKSEKDLLQMILEGANTDKIDPNMADRFIVDNCKSLYFAGHETTAMTASWSLVLLASNPEWQTRVRDEIMELSGGCSPNLEVLRKMKLLNMVILEALRLYPTVVFLSREALEDMKFGDVHVPKGFNIWIPVVTLQQDPEIWGPDAHLFNPERFSNGISGACKLPYVYMPFGVGTRTCVGQNVAMFELKVILSLILTKYSFSLSPKYHHSPVFKLVIEPKDGVNLLVTKV